VVTAVFDQANSVLTLAGQRGLNDKVNAMSASLQKLRSRMDQAEQMLAEVASKDQL
jgi:outer membrane murein-binding lipoprotein Lpp